MDINELRTRIDSVDSELIDLFKKRMDLSAQVAEYKRQNNLPVLDAIRERQKLADVSEQAGEDMSSYVFDLYSLILEMSRSYQNTILYPTSEMKEVKMK